MDMTGEYRIEAPRQVVWEALNDPDVLKHCIPGCETVERQSETVLTAAVMAKVGPVKARFNGQVTLSELNPPESYTISGEGKGGAAGFAKGGARVHLAEDGGETVLSYDVHASVGGKLAQLGARLINSTAKKMADDFFGRFAAVAHERSTRSTAPEPEVAGGKSEPVASAPAPTSPPAASETAAPPAAEPAQRGLSPAIWITGLVVLVFVLILIFVG